MSGRKRPDRDATYGAALMTVGVLLVAFCGACTWNELHSRDELSQLAIFGLVPVGLGVWLFVKGLNDFLDGREP
jgi:hypothetical protein